MHRVMDTMGIVCRQMYISVIFLAQGTARGAHRLVAPGFLLPAVIRGIRIKNRDCAGAQSGFLDRIWLGSELAR